jgi:hypothetical protein
VKEQDQTLRFLRDISTTAQSQAVYDDRQTRFHRSRLTPGGVFHLLIESGYEGQASHHPPAITRSREALSAATMDG